MFHVEQGTWERGKVEFGFVITAEGLIRKVTGEKFKSPPPAPGRRSPDYANNLHNFGSNGFNILLFYSRTIYKGRHIPLTTSYNYYNVKHCMSMQCVTHVPPVYYTFPRTTRSHYTAGT